MMDKKKPLNFWHACTLLHKYCQLYASKYQPMEIGSVGIGRRITSVEENLGGVLQKLDVTLQKREQANVSAVSSFVIKCLKNPECQRYIHALEAHGYVYDILDIVTYIDRHHLDKTDNWWEKDDVRMREYNPFPSPRAGSGVPSASGRNSPVDIRKPDNRRYDEQTVAVSLARLRELVCEQARGGVFH